MKELNELKHLLFAAFHNEKDANNAIDVLASQGYNQEDISIITKHEFRRGEKGKEIPEETREKQPSAGRTAVTGGIIGGIAGLLAGLTGIIIAGPIAVLLGLGSILGPTVTGIVIGLITGGLAGYLRRIGLSEERARQYEEIVHAGGTIIAIPVEGMDEEKIRDILNDNNAEDIAELEVEPEEYKSQMKK